MKEAFEFDEYKTTLDWYTIEHHIINYGDYNYFKLQRRYGPSWWLFGVKFIEEEYRYEEKEIGEICLSDLIRFVQWAKTDHGNRILSVNMISSQFDLFSEVQNVAERYFDHEK